MPEGIGSGKAGEGASLGAGGWLMQLPKLASEAMTMKRLSGSMSDMTNANVVTSDLKEHKVISKRHHPPTGRITIRCIPLRQNSQRIACIEQSCEVVIGGLSISGFRHDKISNVRKIALTAGRIADRHKSPSCLRIAWLLILSPRSNSASASASAPRISAISSDESFAVINSAIPH